MTRLHWHPGGPYGGDVLKQEFIAGRWVSTGARKLLTNETPESLMTPSPQETPALGKSGSSNSHARLSPSDSSRWGTCTAAIAAEQENADAIFILDYENVKQLVPYLETFPDELHPHEVRAIEIIKKKIPPAKLTPEQKDDIRRSEGNVNSREGVRAHDFAEAVLRGKRTIESLPEEFRPHIKGYVEYLAALTPEGVEPMIEYQVPLFYNTASTGTLDYGIVTDEKVIIVDYKHGAGKLVEMLSNSQLGIYAMSVVRDAEASGMYFFEPDTVIEIHVFQPRHHEAANLKPWILSLAELEEFCKDIADKAAVIMSGENLEFHPCREACCWCKVGKVGCPAKKAAAVADIGFPEFDISAEDLLEGLPDEDDLVKVTGLKKKEVKAMPVAERITSRLEYMSDGKLSMVDDDFMIMMIEKQDAIEGLISDFREYLSARVLSGEKVPGLGIAWGREGNREWANEEEAETFCKGQGLLLEDRCTIKLKSPTQIEALIADKLKKTARTKTRFGQLVRRSPAKKVMVIDDGSRELVSSDIDDLPEEPEEFDAEEFG